MQRLELSLSLLTLLAACGGSSATTPDTAPPAGSDAGPADCSAARAQLLGAVNTVSTGAVTQLGSDELYVDASAGGISSETTNPWTFINLDSKAKVSVTDTTSAAATTWDLALKRPTLYTNGGDGGAGSGGAVLIAKAFADVTATDATGAPFATESFFDATCTPMLDPGGGPLTTFSAWYDYDPTTHILAPHAGTWLVHGATGKLYKLAILTYYADPDGSAGSGEGGTYALQVEAL